ncbi:hypothetical protein FSP39_008980 [Pinctada imbricata]|uniref:Uncharacterized protein n=1 Tax=Pinctada imbricata TaxID=66713 RepID=A0AA89C293_PINIB|nr:hypothetical protein FSP39_008980 [Pinctada imbricata]
MADLPLVILTIITPVVYGLTLASNFLSSSVGRDLGLFVSSVSQQSDKYEVDITPAGWMFSIWGIIYVWLGLWIVYSLVNLCRRVGNGRAYNSPTLLTTPFFAIFIVNLLCNISWIFLFDRSEIEAAFVALFFIAFTLYVCMFLSYTRLDEHKDTLIKEGRTYDIWLVRILVHNGLGTYAAWTSIATLLNLAIVMIYSPSDGVSNKDASTVALSLLLVGLLAYAIADFVFLDRYTRYTVTPFIVVPLALGASISKNWKDADRNSIFTAALLGIALACFVVKVFLLFWRHFRSSSHSASISESKENISKDPKSVL